MARTLTAANSVITLGVIGLFPVPQQLQGFATDDMFGIEPVESVETMMGVDGRLSAGWVAVSKRMGITLQADSESCEFFDAWFLAQETARESYVAFGIVRLPGIEKSFALTRGFLRSYQPMAEVKKSLQPRKFSIEWESVLPAPI